MKGLLLTALLLTGAASASASPARPCFNDIVRIADSAGTSLILGSGQRFEVYPGKNAVVTVWAPLDKVTVCALGGAAYQISNLTRHNSVPALRLFD